MDSEDDCVTNIVLRHVFPKCESLESFLSRAVDGRVLTFANDSPHYISLMRGSLVGVPASAGEVPSDLDYAQYEPHAAVINGLVADLMRDRVKSSRTNVLCFGHWTAKSASINGVDGMMGGVEVAWPNSALNLVRSNSWQLLHKRIGTVLLRYVLRELVVFFGLSNNCFLQLSGAPISEHIKQQGGGGRNLDSTLLAENRAHQIALSKISQSASGGNGKDEKKNQRKSSISSGKKLASVNRSQIFYNDHFVRRPGFSESHVLSHSSCRPTQSFGRHLCRVVFHLGAQSGTLPKRYRGLVVPMIQLAHNHHNRLRYGVFLRLFCPLPDRQKTAGGSAAEEHPVEDSDEEEEMCLEDIVGYDEEPMTYRNLIGKYSAPYMVYRFVWVCIYRLVPESLWGCESNRNLGRDMIHQFCFMRRYEEFSVQMWAARWKMRPCKWIPPTRHDSQYEAHRQMVVHWLAWMMNSLVIPLLRNHFYITESAVHRNKVFYYRKPLWSRIVTADLGKSDGMSVIKDMYRPMNAEEVLETRANRFNLPESQLRLLPKANGMRLIGNLSFRKRVIGQRSDSANFLLRPSFEALRWELLRNGKQDMLGASVFSLGEAHDKLLPMIEWLRSFSESELPQLYFVSVDVKGSFDSVNQKKLCNVLFEGEASIFGSEQYARQSFSSHIPCVGHLVRTPKYMTMPSSELKPLHLMLVDDMQESSSIRNSVLVDSSNGEFFERSDLEGILRHHITNNVISMRGQSYLQEVGIPQGSVLSSLLCSLFYGHMERHGLADLPLKFDPTAEKKGLLARFIDDNLFVTTDRDVAVDFVNRLHSRFVEEYGTRLNASKTLVNFECAVDDGAIVLPLVRSDAGFPTLNPCLPWCGVLIDTVTFEFYGDYSRYRGSYMSESLTVTYYEHPGQALRQKIKQFAQPKCIPLLLDSINSVLVIRINVYQIFLLSAIKFHCHVQCLPQTENQRFLFDVIIDVIEYANALIQARVKGGANKHLTPRHVRFLGQHAFSSILRRKHIHYPDVLRVLTWRLTKDKYFDGLMQDRGFIDATDPNRHRLFANEILF